MRALLTSDFSIGTYNNEYRRSIQGMYMKSYGSDLPLKRAYHMLQMPAIPTGRNKRKMPATPDMQFFDKYKEASTLPGEQTGDNSAEEPSSKRRNMGGDYDDDEDAPYTAERYQDEDTELDDEEGRFFGGGLTSEQSNILDLVDEYDVDEVCLHMKLNDLMLISTHRLKH